MSFADRLDRKIKNDISSGITLNNSIDNVVGTTINGYRGLHINQLYRFGYGSATKQSASTTRIDDYFETGGDFFASK